MLRLTPNRPEVLDEVFDGEAVLVHLGTGRYYALSPAATEIWAALGTGSSWSDLTSAVTVPEPELTDFVHRLVDDRPVAADRDPPPPPEAQAGGRPTPPPFTP